MKYYIIAGEASGDLHASNLMKALLDEDPRAEFRFFGGDLMEAVGGRLVKHYKDLAYMGFVPVLMHLRTIFRGMDLCVRDILKWRPDTLILVDYPGFNLKVAKRIKRRSGIPVWYYISPKIWAWKEWRIKSIRKYVDEMFSILPFEKDFYKKHHYHIHYVGNPCVDAVCEYLRTAESIPEGSGKPVIALLPGSRKQEIKDNLSIMMEAVSDMTDYRIVVAGAPGIDPAYYRQFVREGAEVVFGQTYAILRRAEAALVTSGTATLETALLRVPQVVCYYLRAGKLFALLRRLFLKVKFISLVNLIAGKEVVTELVADRMTVSAVREELDKIVKCGSGRQQMLYDYDRIIKTLGEAGASGRAAKIMVKILRME